MSYHRGRDRTQVQLLPECLDDYVAPNAPVRFIDEYVEGLDFKELEFKYAQTKTTGRRPYHPADLLKLYFYGYLYRIRSSRRLEAECGRNMELIWLLGGLRPDFKTIADFRKDNIQTFKPLLKNFNLVCRRMDLFAAELVAIDGSKFKALNNPRRHYTQEQLKELLGKIEKRIEEYLEELDHQDNQAQGVAAAPKAEALEEKLAELRGHKGRYDELLGELQAKDQKEVSLTDADSRKMRGAHGEHLMGYNLQVAVDSKNALLVTAEVVQAANDRNQLSQMAVAAKEELGVEKLQVVADKGYHDADQLQACEKAGVETFVPEQGTTSGQTKNGQRVFAKEQFAYDPQADVYRCPANQVLPRAHQSQKKGKDWVSYYHREACQGCPLKSQCTTSGFRKIGRRLNEQVVERAAARVAAAPQIVAERKKIVEHVFGTLRNWGHDKFLLKGLKKVGGESSLSAVVYNLRRVINLRSIEEFRKALQGMAEAALAVG